MSKTPKDKKKAKKAAAAIENNKVVAATEPTKQRKKRTREPVFEEPDATTAQRVSELMPASTESEVPIDLDDLALVNTGDIVKDLLSSLISSYYQVQKLRIQMGNKLAAHFYQKLGLVKTETLIKQQQGDKKTEVDLLDVIKAEYVRVADALSDVDVVRQKHFMSLTQSTRGIFDRFVEFSWMAQYRVQLVSENRILKDVAMSLEEFPIWTQWLKHIKGVGPTLGGVIISKVNIHIADTPASLHAFAGLDVVLINNLGEEENRGRGRYKEHLVERTYTDKDGNEKTRMSITFDPILKTKLVGVLGDIFIKQNTPVYRQEYDNYKARITQREAQKFQEMRASGDCLYRSMSKDHINNMAIRYMVKRFLITLYYEWRRLEGLPIVEEYGVRKLGLKHHQGQGAWDTAIRARLGMTSEADPTPQPF